VTGRRYRVVCALIATTFVALWPGAAAAELRVKWDCYLPSGNVDCAVLQSSLTSKIPFVTMASDPGRADVSVTITSLPTEDGTRYRLDFVGKRVDGYATEVHTTDRIPSSIDSATATVRLMTKLERGLDDFMDQKIAAEVKDGKLVLDCSTPFVCRSRGGRSRAPNGTWRLGSARTSATCRASGSTRREARPFNYSERTWRAQQSMSVNYNQQCQPVAGTTETASIQFFGANAINVLAWSLGSEGRWSAGLLLSGEKNPQANYTFRANGSVGLEFDLIPRQTVNQKNFGSDARSGPSFSATT
jgi:hypothetical protein